jgi:hypothetical protein
MPFKSKAQQGFMFANKPKLAAEMADKMSSKMFKDLPDKVNAKKGKRGKVKSMLSALQRMSD